ncbi:MAG: aspartate kinase, partial [Nitrososphaeraceae archaeon]
MRFVMKFGGTAINSANKVIHVANLIKSQKQKESNDIVGVVSAVRGMTDGILSISDSIKRGDKTSIEDFINNARDIHTTIIDQAIADKKIKNEAEFVIMKLLDELQDILGGIVLLAEITPRSLDYLMSFGE